MKESQTDRKHTPLPWKAGPDVGGAIGIRSGDGPPVAVVRYSDNPAISREAAHANAELIELAVNSFDDLLKALENIVTVSSEGSAGDDQAEGLIESIYGIARAAIAKAKP